MDIIHLLLRNMHTLLLHPSVLIPTFYLAILTFYNPTAHWDVVQLPPQYSP
jgi:hypothetical protein